MSRPDISHLQLVLLLRWKCWTRGNWRGGSKKYRYSANCCHWTGLIFKVCQLPCNIFQAYHQCLSVFWHLIGSTAPRSDNIPKWRRVVTGCQEEELGKTWRIWPQQGNQNEFSVRGIEDMVIPGLWLGSSIILMLPYLECNMFSRLTVSISALQDLRLLISNRTLLHRWWTLHGKITEFWNTVLLTFSWSVVRVQVMSNLVLRLQIDNGLMTPTMKVRRDRVVAKYKAQLSNLFNWMSYHPYPELDPAIWSTLMSVYCKITSFCKSTVLPN